MNHNKMIALLLVLLLLLPACSEAPSEGGLRFYYLRSQIAYDSSDGIIAPEFHNSDEAENDLRSLLERYLKGPETAELRTPFPDGIELTQIHETDTCLELELSDHLGSLTGMELTLACACIAKTCFEISAVQEVRIYAQDALLDGAEYISITPDSLLLADYSGN